MRFALQFHVRHSISNTLPVATAVPWGNYTSHITGGTGKFALVTGYLDYLGMADFTQNTLVLRYRGQVCYAPWARYAAAGQSEIFTEPCTLFISFLHDSCGSGYV